MKSLYESILDNEEDIINNASATVGEKFGLKKIVGDFSIEDFGKIMRKVFKASFFKEVEKKHLDKKYKGDTLRKQIDRAIDDINVYDCIAQTILDTPVLEWQNNLIAYLNKYTKSGYVIKPYRSMSSKYGKESLYILIMPKGPKGRTYEVDIHLWKEKIGTY